MGYKPLAIFTAISVAAHAALFGLWAGSDSPVKNQYDNAIEIGLVKLPRIDLENSRAQSLSNSLPAETVPNPTDATMPPSAAFRRPSPSAEPLQKAKTFQASMASPDAIPLDLPASEGASQPTTTAPDTAPGQSPVVAVEAAPLHASNPAPAYPEEALRYGWEGEVWLKVEVGRHGEVKSVMIDRSSGYPTLDKAAAQAVHSWQFEPARVGTVAVEGTVRIPVRFSIRRT